MAFVVTRWTPGASCWYVEDMKIGGTTALEFHCSGSCPAWIAKVPKCGKDFPIAFEVNSSAIFKGVVQSSTLVPRLSLLSLPLHLCLSLKERPWARSIQPKFPEISVQNSMDRFGPTGKVWKKRFHLLRWSSFPGRTGWNFGWMDRAPWLQLVTWPPVTQIFPRG